MWPIASMRSLGLYMRKARRIKISLCIRPALIKIFLVKKCNAKQANDVLLLLAGNGNDKNFQGGYFRNIFGLGVYQKYPLPPTPVIC